MGCHILSENSSPSFSNIKFFFSTFDSVESRYNLDRPHWLISYLDPLISHGMRHFVLLTIHDLGRLDHSLFYHASVATESTKHTAHA